MTMSYLSWRVAKQQTIVHSTSAIGLHRTVKTIIHLETVRAALVPSKCGICGNCGNLHMLMMCECGLVLAKVLVSPCLSSRVAAYGPTRG